MLALAQLPSLEHGWDKPFSSGTGVRQFHQVVVRQWHPYKLCLTTGVPPGEVRITKYSAHARSVELLVQFGSVGFFTGCRQSILAVPALSAGDNKTVDDTLPWFERGHGWADSFDNATKLVAENVALLNLQDRAVHDVDVATAHGSASHSDDSIMILNNPGFARFN